MIRTRVGTVAALAAGLAVLAACGPGQTGPSGAGSASPTTSLQLASGTARDNNAPPDTGDFHTSRRTDAAAMKWVQLSVGNANGLTGIVRDAVGFTFYRFDKDTENPTKSNCNAGDGCTTTWPPVLLQPGSRVFLDGIDKSQVGSVQRDDGTLQLTIGHRPVYRFSKDTRPGQTNGEGVKGVWFAVDRKGGKVLPPNGGTGSSPQPGSSTTSPANSGGSPVALGNGSVILDSGKNFSEPDGSEGAAGPGCVNLANPGLASSLVVTGGPIKIWTGRDCTGKSAVVSSDIADLSTIGFDKKIVSIRFGG